MAVSASVLRVSWWALRDSNPRPSPCKGGGKDQVSDLTSKDAVTLGVCEYLRVSMRRGAGVVQACRDGLQIGGRDRAKPSPASVLVSVPAHEAGEYQPFFPQGGNGNAAAAMPEG